MDVRDRMKKEIIETMKDNVRKNVKLEGYDKVVNNLYLHEDYKKDVVEMFNKLGIEINYNQLIDELKSCAKEYLKECNK